MTPPRKPARPPRKRPGAWRWLLAALAVAVFAILIVRMRPHSAADPWREVPSRALADSARGALATHAWARALRFSRIMADREPGNPSLLLGLRDAINNLAWGGYESERVRTSTRTSLERIRLELEAIALMDSASHQARDERDWTRSELARGETYENLGLPIDALEIYTNILARVPDCAPAAARARFVASSLRDPVSGSAHHR